MSEEIARLYDAHAAGLYRYALMILGDHGLAEDVVQQVFAKIVSSGIGKVDRPEHYLRRAVRNGCYSTLRRRRTERDDERPLLEPTSTVIDHAERLAIEAALRTLPVDQREVIALKAFEGFTFQEIADLTEVPLNTVTSRYRYAIDKLRAALGAELK